MMEWQNIFDMLSLSTGVSFSCFFKYHFSIDRNKHVLIRDCVFEALVAEYAKNSTDSSLKASFSHCTPYAASRPDS
jgi:hypothetical protein